MSPPSCRAFRTSTSSTEPARRNTAPAIARLLLRHRVAASAMPSSPCLPPITSSPTRTSSSACSTRAYDFAAVATTISSPIGIEPTEPNTGYGYLELGDEIEPGVIALRRFTEKPSRERRRGVSAQPATTAGTPSMFVWRASVFRRALETAAPEIASLADRIVSSGDPGKRVEHYEAMPSISIDYALMEKAPHVAAIRGDFGWSDVGSFEALERVGVPWRSC